MFLQAQTFIPDDFGGPATHVTGSEASTGDSHSTKYKLSLHDYDRAYLCAIT
jgi:hypothetical protein